MGRRTAPLSPVDVGTVINAIVNPDTNSYLLMGGGKATRASYPDLAAIIPVGSQPRPFLNWTARSLPASFSVTGMAANSTIAVVCGTTAGAPALHTTTDGISFTSRTHNLTGTGGSRVWWDGSQFIACSSGVTAGNNMLSTSPDGITWTARRTAAATNDRGFLYQASPNCARNGTTILIPLFYNGANVIMRSTDSGATWTNVLSGMSGYGNVAFGNSIYVAADQNFLQTSADGGSWTSRTAPWGTGYPGDLYFDGTAFICPTTNGIFRSTDGINWQATYSGNCEYGAIVPIGTALYINQRVNGTTDRRIIRSDDTGLNWFEYGRGIMGSGAKYWAQRAYISSTRKFFAADGNSATTDFQENVIEFDPTTEIYLPNQSTVNLNAYVRAKR